MLESRGARRNLDYSSCSDLTVERIQTRGHYRPAFDLHTVLISLQATRVRFLHRLRSSPSIFLHVIECLPFASENFKGNLKKVGVNRAKCENESSVITSQVASQFIYIYARIHYFIVSTDLSKIEEQRLHSHKVLRHLEL